MLVRGLALPELHACKGMASLPGIPLGAALGSPGVALHPGALLMCATVRKQAVEARQQQSQSCDRVSKSNPSMSVRLFSITEKGIRFVTFGSGRRQALAALHIAWRCV